MVSTFAAMPWATLLCFALTLASLSLWRLSRKSLSKRRAARFCGALVALAGLLTLSQYLGDWNIPLRSWLFHDAGWAPPYMTRMSFNNALCFTFTGLALMGLRSKTERRKRIAQLLSFTSGFGAMTTIIGSLYGAPGSIGFFSFTGAAAYSALAILALNTVALATQERGGMIASFVSRGPEGILARRLALGGGLTLLGIGFLTEWGERASYLQPQAQKALLIVSGMAIMAILVRQAMADIARLDVTRSRAESALRHSEERYRAVTELTSDYVYEYSVAAPGQLTLEKVTAAFTRITGFSPEESREQDGWKSYISPEDELVVQRRLQRLLAGEEDVSEYRIITRDGETRWLRDYGRAVWDEAAGRVTRIYGAVEDITDRKQAEIELERLYEQERAARSEAERMRAVAEAANRSKDEFLTMVSHELRSPLNIVLGYTRLMSYSPNDADFVSQAATTIERNAKAQLQIVEDLLDSARVITGRLRLEAQPTDLRPVIEAAIAAIRPAVESKGVELIAHFSPQPEMALGDADRLQQIVWNLLSNAVKFTPEGGRVELRMESDAERIRIIVSDNGEGIEPEFLPYVFDRFRQADTSVRRRFGGLGLGLSLVKQLTELHGGTISAASEGSGHGATFVVILPRLAAQFATSQTQQTEGPGRGEVLTDDAIPLDAAPSLHGSRILIVDDQEEARTLLRLALEECGAQAMAVSSGVEALAVLADPPDGVQPDALILDIAMPEEDGYSVLHKVREWEAEQGLPASEQIPAIALTAFGRSEDRRRALAAGFLMHVAKPVEPLELAIVVSNVIQKK
jgi:PAS domain S-box-containing protein